MYGHSPLLSAIHKVLGIKHAHLRSSWYSSTPYKKQYIRKKTMKKNKVKTIAALLFISTCLNAQDFRRIGVIQGEGFQSPFAGDDTEISIDGYVTGKLVFGQKTYFFVQDKFSDHNDLTSDGILVDLRDGFHGAAFDIGQSVSFSGYVKEYKAGALASENICQANETNCVTMLADAENHGFPGFGRVPDPVILNPPDGLDAAREYKEMLESMNVTLVSNAQENNHTVIVGPTDKYNTAFVTAANNLNLFESHLMKNHAGSAFGLKNWENSGQINGEYAPSVIVGSKTNNALTGPLLQDKNQYTIITQQSNPWDVIEHKLEPQTPIYQKSEGEISIGSFNALDFNIDNDNQKLEKIKNTIIHMGCPSIMALQEAKKSTVLQLIPRLSRFEGCHYSMNVSDNFTDSGNKGNVVIYNLDDAIENIHTIDNWQACHPDGTNNTTDHFCENNGLHLFSRRPVVFIATVQPQYTIDTRVFTYPMRIAVVAVHLKSFGNASADRRRQAQSDFIREHLNELSETVDKIILVGDMNSTLETQVIATLADNTNTDLNLQNTWMSLDENQRFSYIFKGASEVLDHGFVARRISEVGGFDFNVFHYNSIIPKFRESDLYDIPRDVRYLSIGNTPLGTSDHDPILISIGASEFSPEYAVNFGSCLFDFIALNYNLDSTKSIPKSKNMPSREVLHQLRDDYLLQTINGKKWVEAYYHFSPEIFRLILDKDFSLAKDFYRIFNVFYPPILRFIDNQNQQNVDYFSKQDKLLLDTVLQKLELYGSSELKLLISKDIKTFPFENYIEKSMDILINDFIKYILRGK
jgi:hypothetical protein